MLSGRGIDDDIERIEKLRIAMEERADERNVGRYTRAEEAFAAKGGYAAESEARAIAAGLGLPPDRLDLPVGVLSGGERRRVELVRILFAGSDVLCLDEPTNHLDIDAKEWLLGFLRSYRGALLVISHDLDLLDEAITRVLHLDRATEDAVGHLVEYRGTYSQYVAARHEDEERQAKLAARQAKEIARLQTVVDRFGAKATKAAMAHSIEKRIARLEAERVDDPSAARSLRGALPARRRVPGRTVIERRRARPSPTAARRSSRTSTSTSAAASGCSCSASTAPARRACCASSPARPTPTAASFEFGHHVVAGYYAQEHDNLRSTASLLDQHPRRGADRT